MNAKTLQPANLAELHQIVLRLMHTAPSAGRGHLINEVVSHGAFDGKLNTACGVLMKNHARNTDLLNDVRQAAILRLIERLTNDNLDYHDKGVDLFGGWLYRICRSACADAWKAMRPPGVAMQALANDQILSQCAWHPDEEHQFDKLLRAIDSITDPLLREIMLEFSSRLSLGESACRHELSRSVICRVRQKGVRLLRRFYLEEAADHR